MSRQAVTPGTGGVPAPQTHRRRWARRCGLALAFAVCYFGVSARALDVVIFKDGFKIQGRKFKELESISDTHGELTVRIPAAKGFDIVDDGPRWIVFSSNTRQAGETRQLPDKEFKEYQREVFLRGGYPLPPFGEFKAAPFDDNWKRTIEVKTGGGNFQRIEQRVAVLNPQRVVIPSTTHSWVQFYHPRELGPTFIRNLLASHPDLVEPNGRPDVGKRLDIATFMRDAGFLAPAKDELDKLKAAVPGPWSKDQTERYETLKADLDTLESAGYVNELEAALGAGRYEAGRALIARLDGKLTNARDTKRFADARAQIEIVRPRYEQAVRLLRNVLDELGSSTATMPPAAVAGGWVVPFARQSGGNPLLTTLIEAGEQVLAELHPDSTARLELFLALAAQADKARKAGRPVTPKPEQLVALAVTAWLKGKNGAEQNVETATRLWRARELLIGYQNEELLNNRRLIAQKFVREVTNRTVPFDELAQLISLLPPPKPEDLENPDGTPIQPGNKVLPGLLLKRTGSLPEAASGVEYVLRLPPEYHHGRSYPVLLALTHPGVPAEQLVSLLAADADRYGYIVAAPVWPKVPPEPYDYSGDDHYKATGVLRDLLRHYRVDNDRVFVFGFGDGANFAMDVGASHPDLFAGVVAMGPTPKYFNMFMHYWTNTQKLPVYVITGTINGSSLTSLRQVFEKWMPKGFPAIMSVYRGRGMEWYAAEMPALFDWMGRKKRVTGIASLRLGQRMEPWTTMRTGDNRFYWIGLDGLAGRCQLAQNQNRSFVPGEITADIRGNRIEVRTRGVTDIVIWLDRDMIDWSKPVMVTGTVPRGGYKPKVMKPDLDVMLEELYHRGDRSMLFLNKIELDVVP